MAVALRIEQPDQFVALVAQSRACLIGEHEPVVPIANIILQFFKGLPDRNRVRIFCG